jgi:HEAT repeat protein
MGWSFRLEVWARYAISICSKPVGNDMLNLLNGFGVWTMNANLDVLLSDLIHLDKNKRNQAALSIGASGNTLGLPGLLEQLALESDFFVRETLIWAVVRYGVTAIAPLTTMLADARVLARLLAAQTLGKIGDARAVPALISVLHDADLEVARRAIYALGQIADAGALTALLGLLNDPRQELRSTITKSLEQVGKANLAALAQALKHEHWQVREQVAEVLGLIGDKNAIPDLERAFNDSDARVRFALVTALGHMRDSSVKPTLLTASHDTDVRVRTLALRLMQDLENS